MCADFKAEVSVETARFGGGRPVMSVDEGIAELIVEEGLKSGWGG